MAAGRRDDGRRTCGGPTGAETDTANRGPELAVTVTEIVQEPFSYEQRVRRPGQHRRHAVPRAFARAALDAWLESLRGALIREEIERLSRAAERAQPDEAGELALTIMVLGADAEAAPRALAARMGIDA